ncbi:MAG: hypothetical protein RML72_01760 [Bacteroidia bacterium]|nr:hypothetical protein [Bacteroidia bacterium]MDW8157586.1 hypothetical protein [Bacteroidia bacterium]
MMPLEEFCKRVVATLSPHFQLHSRVTRLGNIHRINADLYLKRDDELGVLGGGTKLRKYASLLPWLKKNQFNCCILIGGAYSNHLTAFVPLLIEEQIEPIVLLRGEPELKMKGNFLLLQTFLDRINIRFINRKDWKNIDAIAHQEWFTQKQKGKKAIIIPEGAAMPPSFSGCCSLFLDILQNEQEYHKQFSNIFIDSGTGFTASVLVLCNHYFQTQKHIHIHLTALNAEEFHENLLKWQLLMEKFVGEKITTPQNFTLYPPLFRFGKVNQTLVLELIRFARTEGILTNPIYTIPLLICTEKAIHEKRLSGNILVIHSGGLLSTLGYDSTLASALHTLTKTKNTKNTLS